MYARGGKRESHIYIVLIIVKVFFITPEIEELLKIERKQYVLSDILVYGLIGNYQRNY